MSAKKKSQSKPVAASPIVTPAPAATTPAPAVATAEPATAWIDSSDPRRRMIGQIALVVIWIYVAALWLLALDQWFNWGIFGPKIPPIP